MKKPKPYAVVVLASLALVGCGGGAPPTNCISQSELDAIFASLNIHLCYADTRQCVNAIGPTIVSGEAYFCAFNAPTAVCGGIDSNGCNRIGQLVYERWDYECQPGNGSFPLSCYDSDYEIYPTGSSCTPDGSGWVLCTDHENPGGSPD